MLSSDSIKHVAVLQHLSKAETRKAVIIEWETVQYKEIGHVQIKGYNNYCLANLKKTGKRIHIKFRMTKDTQRPS